MTEEIRPKPSVGSTSQLTPLEVRLLALIASGKTIDAVARDLGVSNRTVRRHVRQMCDRLGVDTAIEVVIWATKHGLF